MRTGDLNAQDKIDAVLTHPIVGLPIFAVVMFLVFQISQAWLGAWLAEGYEFADGRTIPGLVTLIDQFKAWIISLLESANADPFLTDPLRKMCEESDVDVVDVPTMAELGRACGISVSASAAGLL